MRTGVLADGAAFLVTVVAIACWAAPLTSSMGVTAVEHGLTLALPLTLALQWVLGSRFLDRPQGIAQLALPSSRCWWRGAVAVLLIPTVVLGAGGTLAGLLTVTLDRRDDPDPSPLAGGLRVDRPAGHRRDGRPASRR